MEDATKESSVVELRDPEGTRDALTDLLRDGARKLIRAAVKEEFASFLEGYRDRRLGDGRQQASEKWVAAGT